MPVCLWAVRISRSCLVIVNFYVLQKLPFYCVKIVLFCVRILFMLDFSALVFPFRMVCKYVNASGWAGGYVGRWLLFVLFFVENVACQDVVCLIFSSFLNSELNQLHCFPTQEIVSNVFNLVWLFKLSKWSFFFVVLLHCINIPLDFTVCICVSFAWFSQFNVLYSQYRCANCCSDVWVASASK